MSPTRTKLSVVLLMIRLSDPRVTGSGPFQTLSTSFELYPEISSHGSSNVCNLAISIPAVMCIVLPRSIAGPHWSDSGPHLDYLVIPEKARFDTEMHYLQTGDVGVRAIGKQRNCLLYTSDAADE